MKSLVNGLSVEASEMGVVAVLLSAMVPAYLWVAKAPDSAAMAKRGAVAGSAMIAGALAFGFSRR